MSGRDLPTDQTLTANANVAARAAEYKESGAFGDVTMDQLRATGYLDLLNAVPATDRIACGQLTDDVDSEPPGNGDPHGDSAPSGDGEPRGSDKPPRDDEPPGADGLGNSGGGSGPDTPGHGGGPIAGSGTGSASGAPSSGGATARRLPRPADLIMPLATLLGLAERPGEGHGLGTLDPGLCRDLAAAAIKSPRTELCVTVTDSAGVAIGHGCGRPRCGNAARKDKVSATPNRQQGGAVTGLPARLNLTITAAVLHGLAVAERGLPAGWSFTRLDDHGPPGKAGSPDGYGTWMLTLPDGREFTVRLDPVPTYDCDHRNESHAYQPNDRLRHLVQIRDHQCTFPPCSRHARESDFEHARPYQKGGRTCACNAGARSRKCHRVKQSPGWRVTQPRPGWHQWETPSGRVYTQDPYRYPVSTLLTRASQADRLHPERLTD